MLTGCGNENSKGIKIKFWHTFGQTVVDGLKVKIKAFKELIKENEGLDVVKITFAIMNHSHVGTGVNNNFETFGHLIMDYVPERFRDIKFNRQTDTKHYSTAYQESVERFQEWICMMKAKIENHLSEEYY